MSYWNFPRSPASVRLLIDFGEARKIDAASLLQGTRLNLVQLDHPDSTVSATQELTVIANLLRQTHSEADIGLQVGLSYHLSAYGMLGYGLMSSATGADALKLATRFLPLTYAFTSIAHRRLGELHVLAYEPPDELSAELQRFVVERAMGATSRLLRDIFGNGFELADFSFRFGEPSSSLRRPAPTRVLGASIQYGGAENTLSFAGQYLTQALPQANSVTARMCERMCSDLLMRRRVRLDNTAFVREYMSVLSAGRAPELADVACFLNISERTLKRRLQQEGSSFRALSQAVRQAKAEQMIADGRLTMTEIAAELGFSDLSSFSQAFKRWSGNAPSGRIMPR